MPEADDPAQGAPDDAEASSGQDHPGRFATHNTFGAAGSGSGPAG